MSSLPLPFAGQNRETLLLQHVQAISAYKACPNHPGGVLTLSGVIPPAPNGFDGRSVCGNPSRLRPLPVHDRAIGRQMMAGAGPPANEGTVLDLEDEITPGRVTPTRGRSEQNLKATSN